MDWYVWAFLSAILSAAAAVAQKRVLFDFEALKFSFLLSIFNMIFGVIIFSEFLFVNINATALIILYGKSVLGAFAFWCVMLAIKNMEISGALPLMVLTPGFVAVFGFLLIGDSITSLEIVGLILLLTGTYILESKSNGNLLKPFLVFYESKYHHYIVFALVLFTATSIIDRYLLRDFNFHPKTFVVYQQIFLAVNFFFISVFVNKGIKEIFKLPEKKFFIWFVLISIFTIGYRYTQIEAVKLAPVALVLSVKRLSVLFASVYGGKIFSEHYLLRKTIAVLIMLAGAYLVVNY